MFELQDSKGNRFALSRGAQKNSKSQTNAGSSLQVKRLLRYCDTVTLVRAYSYFFAGQKASIKPLAPNASDSNNDQTVVFETRTLDANSSPTGLPIAQRASAQRFSREQKLFSAIANGELQLEQTHTAQAFDIAKAEKALNLSRSRLLSELNAIAINEHAAAQKHSALKAPPSHWGASSHNPATKNTPKALTIQQHYRRFVTSLPQVIKADGAGVVSAPTGNTEIQSKEIIKALGFSTTKVSTGQFQHALQLVSAIWRDKGLYKTLSQFSNAYATAHEPNASVERSRLSNNAKVSDVTHFELALTLLLSHNQEPQSLSSPSARQIELFPRFKQAGRNLWETADASKTIAAERQTNAGSASFSELATEEAPARERTSPLSYIEIQLLDDKGEPVAGEAYWIRDTEGNEHTGSTDGSGKARVDDIKSGNCLVAFPDIEGSGVHQCATNVDCCTPSAPLPTYVEVKLVDDEENPVANEDYLIICPQGTEYQGLTDASGIARVDGIIEGNCLVSFPNFGGDNLQLCETGSDCCKEASTKQGKKADKPSANDASQGAEPAETEQAAEKTDATAQQETNTEYSAGAPVDSGIAASNTANTDGHNQQNASQASEQNSAPPAPDNSCSISLCYDDTESTPSIDVPYRIHLDNGEVRDGTLDKQGKAQETGLDLLSGTIEFFPDDSLEAIDAELNSAYAELHSAIDHSVNALKAGYLSMPASTERDDRTTEAREALKAAIEEEITALRAQAEEYDSLTFFGKTWEQSKAAAEGLADGVTEYLPDFGEIGDLLDTMDIGTLALIDAIATGDISELEQQFKQWQDRTGAGYEEASESMETLILLLSDKQTREILASTPKRFLEAMPDDELTRIGMTQATQVGLDTGAVIGSTVAVGAVSGPGGAIAGAAVFTATTGRKVAKAFEGVTKTLNKLLPLLKKKLNKKSKPIAPKVDQQTKLPDNKTPKQAADNQQKDQNKKEVRPKISLGHNGKLKAAGYHHDLNECIPAQLNLSITGPGAKEFSGTGKLILEGNGSAKLFEDKNCTKEITNKTFTAKQLDGNGIDIYVKATKMEDLKWRLKLQK